MRYLLCVACMVLLSRVGPAIAQVEAPEDLPSQPPPVPESTETVAAPAAPSMEAPMDPQPVDPQPGAEMPTDSLPSELAAEAMMDSPEMAAPFDEDPMAMQEEQRKMDLEMQEEQLYGAMEQDMNEMMPEELESMVPPVDDEEPQSCSWEDYQNGKCVAPTEPGGPDYTPESQTTEVAPEMPDGLAGQADSAPLDQSAAEQEVAGQDGGSTPEPSGQVPTGTTGLPETVPDSAPESLPESTSETAPEKPKNTGGLLDLLKSAMVPPAGEKKPATADEMQQELPPLEEAGGKDPPMQEPPMKEAPPREPLIQEPPMKAPTVQEPPMRAPPNLKPPPTSKVDDGAADSQAEIKVLRDSLAEAKMAQRRADQENLMTRKELETASRKQLESEKALHRATNEALQKHSELENTVNDLRQAMQEAEATRLSQSKEHEFEMQTKVARAREEGMRQAEAAAAAKKTQDVEMKASVVAAWSVARIVGVWMTTIATNLYTQVSRVAPLISAEFDRLEPPLNIVVGLFAGFISLLVFCRCCCVSQSAPPVTVTVAQPAVAARASAPAAAGGAEFAAALGRLQQQVESLWQSQERTYAEVRSSTAETRGGLSKLAAELQAFQRERSSIDEEMLLSTKEILEWLGNGVGPHEHHALHLHEGLHLDAHVQAPLATNNGKELLPKPAISEVSPPVKVTPPPDNGPAPLSQLQPSLQRKEKRLQLHPRRSFDVRISSPQRRLCQRRQLHRRCPSRRQLQPLCPLWPLHPSSLRQRRLQSRHQ